MSTQKRAVRTYKPEDAPPCDNCSMRQGCAAGLLACPAMLDFTIYGYTDRLPTVPNRECWQAMHSTDTGDIKRAYNHTARAADQARLARIARRSMAGAA